MLHRLLGWIVCVSLMVSAAAAAEPGSGQVVETDVYVAGDQGVHTYRIPAIVVTLKGTILAFCEARQEGRADHGNIDLVVRRSSDGGKTFGPMITVWEDGKHTIGNPCPVVDRATGTIWMLLTRDNDDVFVTHSKDDGQTWATPTNITKDVKKPDWTWYATGPGHGVQLSTGRLIIPSDHRVGDQRFSYSHIVYSDDGGRTWQLGGDSEYKTNECTAVELADGRLLLNMRSYFGQNRRAVAISSDGGKTFGPVSHDETLIEPVCEASIIRYARPGKKESDGPILFSNPASKARDHLTIRLSNDDCRSWSAACELWQGPAAYSDLAITADGDVLCLYERGEKNAYEKIVLARFPLSWVQAGTAGQAAKP
jgi:sialidase-1